MSEPIHLYDNHIINAVSMASDISSVDLPINDVISYAVHAIWSAGATPVGTFDIQASNDAVNYVSVLSAPAPVSGDSGQIMVNVEKPAYGHLKVVYTATSGDGTLDVYINAKRG